LKRGNSISATLTTLSDAIVKADDLNAHAFEIRNNNPKGSSELAQEALGVASEVNYVKGKAEALTNLGFYHMHIAKHETAFSYLLEALAFFEELEDNTGIANAYYNIGLVNLRIGNFDQAIDTIHKSLALRQIVNDKAGIASCYFQMSYINLHFGDVDGAEEAISKSLQLREELNDEPGTAAALMVLGDVYIKRRRLEKARETIQASMVLREKSSEKMGYFATLLRWADIHIELDRLDTATDACTRGLEMATEENIGYGQVRFLQMLGKIEMRRKNIAESKALFLKALGLSDNLSFKSIIFELHQSIMEIYKQEGDYKSAFEHFEKFHAIKEEVISLQSNTQLKSVQFVSQIEFARKEADLEKEKNAELNKANKIITEKNKEITDSINYAKRIQLALITSEKYIERVLAGLKK
jgi:tetratricopeptide (TPR) repeat protein